MARITVEDCLEKVGDDNRFALIHLAVERLRQHREGEPYLVRGKNKEIVMTLREIAAGKVTFDNILETGNSTGRVKNTRKEDPRRESSDEDND